MSLISAGTLTAITDGIAGAGYAIIPGFLPPPLIREFAEEALLLQQDGRMRRALTGNDKSISSGTNPRGDFIYWLDEQPTCGPQRAYVQALREVMESLNQALYLGLFELEAHYAIYPEGAVYHKHLDQFRGKEERQISCILYLNQDWQERDGGKLRLYLNGTDNTAFTDITPLGGTLVTFLSGRFIHEVLPAGRERISLTGWLRKRAITVL